MNRTIIIGLAIFCVLLTNEGCETKSTEAAKKESLEARSSQKEMIVYGSNTCDHCIDFKRKMDSLGVKYTFYDVEVDQRKADEMLAKLEKARFMGYISFPVVDIEGRVMVSPELPMVVGLLKR